MAVRTGLEPATSCVTGRHSNQLNYRTKLRGQDSNLRPSGYEPDELPDCSTPRRWAQFTTAFRLLEWLRAARSDHRLAGRGAGHDRLDGAARAAAVGDGAYGPVGCRAAHRG